MTITQALSGDEQRRQRSLASVRRQREFREAVVLGTRGTIETAPIA